MLDRLIEQRDAVSLVLASVQGVKNLSAQQWTTAAVGVDAPAVPGAHSTHVVPDYFHDRARHRRLLNNMTGGLDVLRRGWSRRSSTM